MTAIAFIHHKGGTGKTTSCLQIAGILKNMGRSVLVIDTDPQANATLGLGVYPETLHRTIYHYYISKCSESSSDVLSDYIIRTISGIDLVPSHLDLAGAEAVLYQNPDRYHILAEGIGPVKNRYDHILIDTPPFLGQFLINGMIAADHVVMVFSPDTFAIAGYDHLNLIIGDISEILHDKIHVGMAILNRWKIQSPKPQTFMDWLSRQFGGTSGQEMAPYTDIQNQLETRIRVEIPEVVLVEEGRSVSQSLQRGIPLITLSPDDPSLQGFKQAARIIDTW